MLEELEDMFPIFLKPTFFNNEIIQQFSQAYELPIYQKKDFQTYCVMIQSENTLDMYEGLVGLRTILFNEIKVFSLELRMISLQMCELNTSKYIIHIIEHNENQLIIYEALRILEKLTFASLYFIDQAIQYGLINCLVQKYSLGNYHDVIIEQVSTIFRGIVRSSKENHNLMIKQGTLKILHNYAIQRINQFQKKKKKIQLIDSLSWSFRSYFYENSLFPFPLKDLSQTLDIFQKWVPLDVVIEPLFQICKSFAKFVRSHPTQIQVTLDLGILQRIILLAQVEVKLMLQTIISLLTYILENHQNHQEYLYRFGIILFLGTLVKKYQKQPSYLKHILEAFVVISSQTHLSSFLLNSSELDLLLSLLNLNDTYISNQIHLIIENLINLYQDNGSISLIQNNKIIILCRMFVSRDSIQQKQELCQKVLNLCINQLKLVGDTYLKEERYCQFHKDLQEIKSQLKQKMKQQL